MAAPFSQPAPQPNIPWVDTTRTPTLPLQQYFPQLDTIVRGIFAFFGAATFATSTAPGSLINAANDAAAAAAGVAIGQLYRNGSVVQIRVT